MMAATITSGTRNRCCLFHSAGLIAVVTVRRERRWTLAGANSRQLVRSTRQIVAIIQRVDASLGIVLGVLADRFKCTGTLPVQINRRGFEILWPVV
jgi:hypothetical protein